jgi:plasmid stabilization system protein ParE
VSRVEIFVRHDAELDAFGYFQYIQQQNPDAAVRFLAAIDRTIDGLALQPLKGRLRKFRGRDLKNIRSWRIDDFESYLIFYRFSRLRLEILRIKHGAMDFPSALRR